MNCRLVKTLLVGFWMLLPTHLFAQKTFALGIAGGAAFPVGNLGDIAKSGVNGTIAIAIGGSDFPVGVRFDGIYNRFPRKDNAVPLPGSTAVYNMRVVGGLVNFIYTFPGTNSKPYLIAGAGYYNTKALLSDAKADNDIGFNGGVGASFGFGPFAAFLEARYHSISRNANKGGVIQFVPVTFGLLF